MTTQDKRLLARARRLKDGDTFTRGEVLDLDVWLEAHKGDGEQAADVGEWGNDADPSAAYVEWLTQGGDEGLELLEAIHRPKITVIEVKAECVPAFFLAETGCNTMAGPDSLRFPRPRGHR